jgi:hypothetical protein
MSTSYGPLSDAVAMALLDPKLDGIWRKLLVPLPDEDDAPNPDSYGSRGEETANGGPSAASAPLRHRAEPPSAVSEDPAT